jgi:O-antigen/teichoic acid export membrane protein
MPGSKMSLSRTIARNSLLGVADMLVDLILPPVASVIVARTLGPAKLGPFSYVLWLVTIATVLPSSGFYAAATKYLAAYAGQRRPDLFRALIRGCIMLEVLTLGISSLVGCVWVTYALPAGDRWFAILLMLSIIPAGVVGMATAINTSMQNLRPNVVASVSGALVHTVGLLLTVVMGWGLVGLAAATLALRICDAGVRWKLTIGRLPRYLQTMGGDGATQTARPKLPGPVFRELAHFIGDSTILAVLSLVVMNRSEFFFLKRYSAVEQIAYFSVAFALSGMLGHFVRPFSWAAAVSVYAERGRDDQAGLHAAQMYWRYLVLLAFPAAFGLSVMSGPLLRLLYGVRYLDAAPVLVVAGALGVFGPLASPLNTLISAAGGQRRLVGVGLTAAVVTLGLDYFLVRSFDAIGGAVANGVGQATFLALTLLVARRYLFRASAAFFFRVALAAAMMALLVGIAIRFLPDIASVVVGPVLGMVAYVAFLRIGRIVDAQDIERLGKAGGALPGPLRNPFRKLTQFLVPPKR